jgi:hypothetical protein
MHTFGFNSEWEQEKEPDPQGRRRKSWKKMMRAVLMIMVVLACSTCAEKGSSRAQIQGPTRDWFPTSAEVAAAVQEYLHLRCVYIAHNKAVDFGKQTYLFLAIQEGIQIITLPCTFSRFHWTANDVTILEIPIAARETGSIFWSGSTWQHNRLQTLPTSLRHTSTK